MYSLQSHFQCCPSYNTFSLGEQPPKLPLPLRGSKPPQHGPTRVHNPDGNSIGSAVSLLLTVFSPYTLQWGRTCPPKIVPSPRGIGPFLICGSLGPLESTTQTASWSVQLLLQGSHLYPTDTQTDHTMSLAVGCVLRFAWQCSLIIIITTTTTIKKHLYSAVGSSDTEELMAMLKLFCSWFL